MVCLRPRLSRLPTRSWASPRVMRPRSTASSTIDSIRSRVSITRSSGRTTCWRSASRSSATFLAERSAPPLRRLPPRALGRAALGAALPGRALALAVLFLAVLFLAVLFLAVLFLAVAAPRARLRARRRWPCRCSSLSPPSLYSPPGSPDVRTISCRSSRRRARGRTGGSAARRGARTSRASGGSAAGGSTSRRPRASRWSIARSDVGRREPEAVAQRVERLRAERRAQVQVAAEHERQRPGPLAPPARRPARPPRAAWRASVERCTLATHSSRPPGRLDAGEQHPPALRAGWRASAAASRRSGPARAPAPCSSRPPTTRSGRGSSRRARPCSGGHEVARGERQRGARPRSRAPASASQRGGASWSSATSHGEPGQHRRRTRRAASG